MTAFKRQSFWQKPTKENAGSKVKHATHGLQYLMTGAETNKDHYARKHLAACSTLSMYLSDFLNSDDQDTCLCPFWIGALEIWGLYFGSLTLPLSAHLSVSCPVFASVTIFVFGYCPLGGKGLLCF